MMRVAVQIELRSAGAVDTLTVVELGLGLCAGISVGVVVVVVVIGRSCATRRPMA
jgi:hypothetical protein